MSKSKEIKSICEDEDVDVLDVLNNTELGCVTAQLKDDNPENKTGWRALVEGYITSDDGFASKIWTEDGDKFFYNEKTEEWEMEVK
jgi:hypothetical protein